MLTKTEVKELINDVFEQQALVLGGLVAMQGMDEELVWSLVRSMDTIRMRTLRSLGGGVVEAERDEDPVDRTPHPAIQDFLLKLRRA